MHARPPGMGRHKHMARGAGRDDIVAVTWQGRTARRGVQQCGYDVG
jgi:hypothetical protein